MIHTHLHALVDTVVYLDSRNLYVIRRAAFAGPVTVRVSGSQKGVAFRRSVRIVRVYCDYNWHSHTISEMYNLYSTLTLHITEAVSCVGPNL